MNTAFAQRAAFMVRALLSHTVMGSSSRGMLYRRHEQAGIYTCRVRLCGIIASGYGNYGNGKVCRSPKVEAKKEIPLSGKLLKLFVVVAPITCSIAR